MANLTLNTKEIAKVNNVAIMACLLYTSDAADEL